MLTPYACGQFSMLRRHISIFRVEVNKVNEQFCAYLHNEELRDLYSSPSIIGMIKWKKMRLTRHVARMEEKKNECRLLVGKPEGRRPLGRPIL
jgi:hypothetical protein